MSRWPLWIIAFLNKKLSIISKIIVKKSYNFKINLIYLEYYIINIIILFRCDDFINNYIIIIIIFTSKLYIFQECDKTKKY